MSPELKAEIELNFLRDRLAKAQDDLAGAIQRAQRWREVARKELDARTFAGYEREIER